MISEFILPSSVIAGFIQFVADNVDHNGCFFDGRETFHGMRIIVYSIDKRMMTNKRIKMLAKVMESSDAAKRVVKVHSASI